MFKTIKKVAKATHEAAKTVAKDVIDASKAKSDAIKTRYLAKRTGIENTSLKLDNKAKKWELKHAKNQDRIAKIKAKKLSPESTKIKQRHKTIRSAVRYGAAAASANRTNDFKDISTQFKESTSGMTISNGQDNNDPNTASNTTYSNNGYQNGDHI